LIRSCDEMFPRIKLHFDFILLMIVLLAAFLNGYNIWTDQYANTYYTTAVASMMKNFHNFFFASLDSAGSVTVDKPPLTFWIQTISAFIFGLHGWSVILPQALAGVGSVLIIYFLVKPTFGLGAARLGALSFACTPIAAAVSRTNNIDSMLVFTLLLATWLLFRSVKRSSVGYLLGAFAVIGLAFNMKMLQAYMILPAFYLFYLLASNVKWKKKIQFLTGATIIMLVISLSWAVIVDAIPQDKRPYIGSSETNSVLELAFGYNGVSRLTGNQGGGGAPDRNVKEQIQMPQDNDVTTDENAAGGFVPPNGNSGNGDQPNAGNDGGGPGGGKSGGMFGTGEKGPLRLFQSELSGQASWLLPFVAFASVGLLAGIRIRNLTMKQKETIFWLTWLIPVLAFFSVAGFFHHYYLIMLAPPIAALFGAGWSKLFNDYRNKSDWMSWLIPAAIAAAAIFHWYIIHPYDQEIGSGWSIGILCGGLIVCLAFVFMKFRKMKLYQTAGVIGMLVLLIGPLYWAATPITYGGNSMIPQAGPTSADGRGNNVMGTAGRRMPAINGQEVPDAGEVPNGSEESTGSQAPTSGEQPSQRPGGMNQANLDSKTLSYLKKNNTGEEYLFATTSYQTAAPYMIDKGESVITLGGFSGSDPVYSVNELKELVSSGKVKYFLISERGMHGGDSEVTEWIQENGEEIPSEDWQSTQNSNEDNANMRGPGESNKLYKVTVEEE
jgi:4-amino-4-deoxy-L-arabinose transferase-like glycosyltransferase